MRNIALASVATLVLTLVSCDSGGDSNGESGTEGENTTRFVITLENVSTPLMTSTGETVDHMFAPGVWALHGDVNAIFTPGLADRGQGLEALAEDGNNQPLSAALISADGIDDADMFSIPQGTYDAGAIGPGDSFEFEVDAAPGQRLSFAGMFVQSNDIFTAPGPMGMALFDADGMPLVGDRSSELHLWDAGTEVNEEPGVGENQAPRQSGPDTGMDEDGVVQDITIVADGFTYPAPTEFLKVTVAVDAGG